MLSASPRNSATWYLWSLNTDDPTSGSNYIKEAISPEAAQSNGFSHRVGVLLVRFLFLASSMVYWYSRNQKPTSSAPDVIVGISLAFLFLISVAHFILSSKEESCRMLTYCNIGVSCCQIGALVALFFGIKPGEISPLNLAMLVGLMMGETSSSRSMLAVTIFTTISLAVDPTNRVDYSSVVVSVVGLFLIFILLSFLLWYNKFTALELRFSTETTLKTQDDVESTPRIRSSNSVSAKSKGFFESAFGSENKPQRGSYNSQYTYKQPDNRTTTSEINHPLIEIPDEDFEMIHLKKLFSNTQT